MHGSFTRVIAAACIVFALALIGSQAAPASAATPLACGTVDLGSTPSTDLARAFDCFGTAFTHCDDATLVATATNGADAETSTFVTFPGDNGCAISETVERTTGGNKTVDTYVCRSVSRDGDALHFRGCGAQRDVSLGPIKS